MAAEALFGKASQDAFREAVKDPEVQSILSGLLAQRRKLIERVQAVAAAGAEGSVDTLPSQAAARAKQQGADVSEADIQAWLKAAESGNVAVA